MKKKHMQLKYNCNCNCTSCKIFLSWFSYSLHYPFMLFSFMASFLLKWCSLCLSQCHNFLNTWPNNCQKWPNENLNFMPNSRLLFILSLSIFTFYGNKRKKYHKRKGHRSVTRLCFAKISFDNFLLYHKKECLLQHFQWPYLFRMSQ